ncbi:class I SAM-dependent methyltransferase [Gloeobacter kilaueensis]|uniref:3-demethylubiquinone-9 3-methyltransferase n=1 Tax=Gloeobacter kilaueensis (strain ATCC BAA-2537 / CCAP 1431/1 / ULC 316 / JS1) TaxID=1183438 RepID=U5QFH5_GLOK1|nr:methyltransferase domain-containing protein [Gloeobacter kilaueensis]AGY56425.1 3-demethylubiquinone-9 3-methyltransferase [Gloeobacter kilaueensis JS1]
MSLEADYLQQLLRQYDTTPYPNIPLHHSHREDTSMLYLHNLQTPYYLRNRRRIETAGKRILDVGCGSGFSTLALAEANPGAQITGIDLSPRSVEVARERLAHHGFPDAQFHVIGVEELAQLGEKFDYINCDEVIYILPDPVAGLASLTAVLAPDGIVRANLHSEIVRAPLLHAQKMFTILGLDGSRSEEEEVALSRETMEKMIDGAQLKKLAWTPFSSLHDNTEWYRMNYLLRGDKGFTVPDMFRMLAQSNLELVNMLLWPTWDPRRLFKEGELPQLLVERYDRMSLEERLQLTELINSSHRLLDFWCGHRGEAQPFVPLTRWSDAQLTASTLHLHPQLATPRLKEFLLYCLESGEPFNINQHMRVPYGEPIAIDGMEEALLPLWNGPQPYANFQRQWVRLAVRRTTVRKPVFEHEARSGLRRFVTAMEALAYLMVEAGL